ncbi:MAG TPA: hypothetical protein VLT89_06015 [Usitatibacter sp.]|nr:hypothetical protein [Usitatibacter sp.]
MDSPVVVDSATRLGPGARGAVAVCGSHGGVYAGWLAAKAGVRAIVLNDAGIGRHSAGTAGVAWLDSLGIAACAVDYRSARIADGADMLANGVISVANATAAHHGCLPGHSCRKAVDCLLEHAERSEGEVPDIGEARARIANSGHRTVWAIDSMSLARDSDARAIVLTGSHGGLLGGKADAILPMDIFAAFFNDAGGGKDDAGFARLPVLDARGVAAGTVSHNTARIGDGRSTYETGVLSRVNESARRLELREGMSAREAVARLVGLG